MERTLGTLPVRGLGLMLSTMGSPQYPLSPTLWSLAAGSLAAASPALFLHLPHVCPYC